MTIQEREELTLKMHEYLKSICPDSNREEQVGIIVKLLDLYITHTVNELRPHFTLEEKKQCAYMSMCEYLKEFYGQGEMFK